MFGRHLLAILCLTALSLTYFSSYLNAAEVPIRTAIYNSGVDDAPVQQTGWGGWYGYKGLGYGYGYYGAYSAFRPYGYSLYRPSYYGYGFYRGGYGLGYYSPYAYGGSLAYNPFYYSPRYYGWSYYKPSYYGWSSYRPSYYGWGTCSPIAYSGYSAPTYGCCGCSTPVVASSYPAYIGGPAYLGTYGCGTVYGW
ncbi:hypothetical protein [Calycomorphotria hydatis]|nr:hypothetical protein [Calycomorphotria hydatis]